MILWKVKTCTWISTSLRCFSSKKIKQTAVCNTSLQSLNEQCAILYSSKMKRYTQSLQISSDITTFHVENKHEKAQPVIKKCSNKENGPANHSKVPPESEFQEWHENQKLINKANTTAYPEDRSPFTMEKDTDNISPEKTGNQYTVNGKLYH